jgi:hypothetical protein
MKLETVILRPIEWQRSPENRHHFFAEIEGQRFELHLNDFPEEPLCTLIGPGEQLDLEQLGEHWSMPWDKRPAT